MSRDEKAGRSHNIKTDNSSFERVGEFKCLGTTLTDQHPIREKIKNILSQKILAAIRSRILSSSSLFKNMKIKVYRTIILSVVLCECGKLSLTLREERRLRVFENRVLRRRFGPKRDEKQGSG